MRNDRRCACGVLPGFVVLPMRDLQARRYEARRSDSAKVDSAIVPPMRTNFVGPVEVGPGGCGRVVRPGGVAGVAAGWSGWGWAAGWSGRGWAAERFRGTSPQGSFQLAERWSDVAGRSRRQLSGRRRAPWLGVGAWRHRRVISKDRQVIAGRSRLVGRAAPIRHWPRPADFGAGQPGGDLPEVMRVDAQQYRATIAHEPGGPHEAGVAQQVQLARGRRATEADLRRQARWSPGSHGDGGHQTAPGRIGQQLDPRTVPFRYLAPLPRLLIILPKTDWLAIIRG